MASTALRHKLPAIRAAGLLASALAVAGCGGGDPRARATSRSQLARHSICPAYALRLTLKSPFSPQTGEHGQVFALSNRGSEACALNGTPHVALYRRARLLPFVYRSTAGGIRPGYSSNARARPVLLQPHSSAYFLVAKFRCDAGPDAVASAISVRLPGAGQALRASLRAKGGVSELVLCRDPPGERPKSVGDHVDVSPFTATVAEASAVPGNRSQLR